MRVSVVHRQAVFALKGRWRSSMRALLDGCVCVSVCTVCVLCSGLCLPFDLAGTTCGWGTALAPMPINILACLVSDLVQAMVACNRAAQVQLPWLYCLCDLHRGCGMHFTTSSKYTMKH
jgi:hypothetical protein